MSTRLSLGTVAYLATSLGALAVALFLAALLDPAVSAWPKPLPMTASC